MKGANIHHDVHYYILKRLLLVVCSGFALPAGAQQLAPDFAQDYTITHLGSVPGLSRPFGGMTFLDNDTLLVSGAANSGSSQIFSIGVTRDPGTQQITGFAGSLSLYADAPNMDAGLGLGPGDVLFYFGFPSGELGQIKLGSDALDKLTDSVSLGISGERGGGVQFVPAGFAGAGQLKLYTYTNGWWRTLPLTPDGNGTYHVGAATGSLTLPEGGQGMVYVSGHNAGFSADSVLANNYRDGKVYAYEIDSNGDPLPDTQRDFLTGLRNVMGATLDPVTGAVLVNTFVQGNRLVAISGFISVPEPGTAALALTTLVAWGFRRRR